MSNLIITIISIALAAIVALFGIYYGGEAYNNYAIKSQASTIISQMSQLYNAGIYYLADTNQTNFSSYYIGSQPANNLSGNLRTLIVPKYLSSLPTPPQAKGLAFSNGAMGSGG